MRLAFVMLAAVLPAVAQQSEPRFRFHAPIELASREPLQRVELPMDVYREAKRDLADVRVLNGRGEPVPIAFAGTPDARLEVGPLVDLPAFPVSSPGPFALTRSKDDQISIRTADGTVVAIRGKPAANPPSKPLAYLLDATALQDAPIRALVFEWDAAPGAQVVNVRVEASEDLKAWSALGSGPLVRLENEGRILSQPRVEFAPRKAKYLRVTGGAPGFTLKRVRAEREPRSEPAARATRTVAGTSGQKAGEFFYDIGGRLPVEAFRLVPAEVNDVLSAAVSARNDEKEPWRAVAWAPFYRLKHDEGEKLSPPVEIGRLGARYWRVNLGAVAGRVAPTLDVRWRPAQVVFVARGDTPFSLAFGDTAAPAVAMPVSAMLPNYERLAELKLPLARAGTTAAAPEPSRWAQMWREASPRRLTLWGILVGGVALLGFIAWRLLSGRGDGAR
ncbi:MAG TPA: DUF3999 domain-containing protein [Usitatibacter sp.]|nr:DUF3999 domain-containing protein [Usitatibacter sp.]